MKLTLMIFFITAGCALGNQSYSQKTELSFDLQKISVKEVLDKIEDQSEFYFLYSNKLIDVERKVSISAEEDKIDAVLNQLFAGVDVSYMLIDRQIVLSPQDYFSDPLRKMQQNPIQVTGTVTDAETGRPLPGVNIVIQGTNKGTTTDMDGEYTIEAPPDATLDFSFVGYQRKSVNIKGREEIDISLQPSVTELEEVVAIGYGTQAKRDLTGSVESVDDSRFEDGNYTTIEEGMKGAVAGVSIKSTSGADPGGEMSLRVRGYSTINSGGEPLVVIDGFPGVGDLNSINPSNIKSIEVLKDASATAIYGARGANGVILVTTKEGQPGRTNVSVDYSVGVQQVNKTYNLLNATEFARYENTVRENMGEPITFENPSKFGEGTNWQQEVFRPAPKQQLQLNVSGGDSTTTYALSGEYFSQEGVVLGSGLRRGSFRTKIESQVTDRLTASASLYLAETSEKLDDPNVMTAALTISPIASVKDDEGNYMTNADLAAQYGSFFFSKGNPVAMAKEVDEKQINTHFIGNGYFEYELLDNLVLKSSLGADINHGTYNYYVPDGIPYRYRIETGGTATKSSSKYLSWLNENTLKYNNEFGNHDIDLTLGATFQEMNYSNLTATAEDFTDDFYKYNDLSLGNTQRPSDSYTDNWFLNSYFLRVNYQFNDKYLLTTTTRVDGSSKFGENNKYGLFPSGAIAWRISEEPFMEDVNFISDLKLRTSYGITGNQEIGSFQSLARMGGTQYIIGNSRVVGAMPVSIANKDLKWEKTAQLDVGIDASLLDNRITFNADYYYKKTTDLLLQTKVPYSSGFATSLENVGAVENKGYELSLSTVNLRSRDLMWRTSFNITFNNNNILDLGDTDQIISNGYLWFFNSYSIAKEGHPVGMFYSYEFDGIWQVDDDIENSAQPNAKPGDQKFVDQNNDGQINAQDRTMIGNPHPDFTFGFTTTFEWKNFELRANINGIYGNEIMNASYIDVKFPNATTNTTHDTYYNRWTPENRSNTHLRAGSDLNPSSSSMYLEDGSYLRISNLLIGYNLPQKWLDRVGIENARVYVNAENLYTLTNYSGYNPEANLFGDDNLRLGYDYSFYPQARTFNVGMNIQF